MDVILCIPGFNTAYLMTAGIIEEDPVTGEKYKTVEDYNKLGYELAVSMLETAGLIFPLKGLAKSATKVIKFASGVGKVFWSGGRDVAGKAAMEWAEQNGYKTLEMTTGGKLLEKFGKYLPESTEAKLWNQLSKNFANKADGTVHVFQNIEGVLIKIFARESCKKLQIIPCDGIM